MATTPLQPADIWAEYLGTIEAAAVLLVRIAVIGYAIVIALREQLDDFTGRRRLQRQPRPEPLKLLAAAATPPAQAAVTEREPLVLRETTAEGVQRYSRLTDEDLQTMNLDALRRFTRSSFLAAGRAWPLRTPASRCSHKVLLFQLRELRSTAGN